MHASLREQLEALGFQASKPIRGGYKEPLIFLKVSADVLQKCKCTKYGHAYTTRKPKDFRPDALRKPPSDYLVETKVIPAESPIPHYDVEHEYGVAFNAVA